MKARCQECMTEPGCEQFEIFQSASEPGQARAARIVERSERRSTRTPKRNATRPPLPEGLRLGVGEREDYQHNRTR
jgi:hypothetical protein